VVKVKNSVGDAIERYEAVNRVHISPIEGLLVVLISASADLFEILGALSATTGVGISIWLLAYVYGWCVSIALIFWSIFRSNVGFLKGRAIKLGVKRLLTIIIGSSVDGITGGVLPTRTVFLCIAIFLTNHFVKEEIKEITEIIEDIMHGHLRKVADISRYPHLVERFYRQLPNQISDILRQKKIDLQPTVRARAESIRVSERVV